MALVFNGNGTVTGLSQGGLPDGCVTNADIDGMAASKLTGALPAISGASLTGISAGISMLDMYYQTSQIAAGNDTEITIDTDFVRATGFANSVFTGIGTGVTKSGSIFSFPSTGHYEITFHVNFTCQGYDSARYSHCDILLTVDNSNYNVVNRTRGQSIEYPTNLSNRFSWSETTLIFDVTNTSTHKVKFVVNHDSPYKILGGSSEFQTYAIFKKIADT